MTRWKREVVQWVRDIRESGIGFALGILLLLAIFVGALDVIYWESDVGRNLLAEANGVLAELFLIGIVISIYDYRRSRKQELSAIEKELAQLIVSNSPEGVVRRTQLIDDLIAKGKKPSSLRNHNLKEARLNGFALRVTEQPSFRSLKIQPNAARYPAWVAPLFSPLIRVLPHIQH